MEYIKHMIDAASFGTAIATLIGWLPPVAAILSIIWSCVCLYDRIQKKKVYD